MRRVALLVCLFASACSNGSGGAAAILAPEGTATVLAPEPLHVAGTIPAETYVDETDRPRVDLGGRWRFAFDDADAGVAEAWYAEGASRSGWYDVEVPGVWDLQVPGGFEKQTVGWFARRFTPPDLGPRARVLFDGVFREARVWLNGVELGAFDLPYLPFGFDATAALRPGAENELVVRIDNRIDRRTMPPDTTFQPGKHGWFPYGGLQRPVYLEGTARDYVAQTRIVGGLDGSVTVDARLAAPASAALVVSAEAVDPFGRVRVRFPETALAPGAGGLRLAGSVDAPLLFGPETPENVYRLRITAAQAGRAETVQYDFGFKEIETDAGRLYYNGEDLFLRGINRHEDHPVHGPVFDEGAMGVDLDLLRGMNVNFSRTAHYPNDVRTLKAMESSGILLCEEIPAYQLDERQMDDPVLIDRSVRSLRSMIVRDWNRPGLVMWSLWNENHGWVRSAARYTRTLQDEAKRLTPTHATFIAQVGVPILSEIADVSACIADVIGINQYFGWYVLTHDYVPGYLENVRALCPEKVFIASEYGADAVEGRHLDGEPALEPVTAHSYTEEFQVWHHEETLARYAGAPWLRGYMPWVFADFRWQWETNTGPPSTDFNFKGLVSYDRAPKAAYETYAALYGDLAE